MMKRSGFIQTAIRAAVLFMLLFLAGAPTGAASTTAQGDEGIGFGSGAAAAPQALVAAAPPASGAAIFVKPAMEFVPYVSTSTFNQFTGWMYNTGASNAALEAFLDLPHQATIQKVIIYFYDADPGANITGGLYLIPNNSAVAVTRGTFTTSGAASGYGYVEVTGITNPVVDLTAGALLVEVTLPPTTNVRVAQVRVDYSYNTMLPTVIH